MYLKDGILTIHDTTSEQLVDNFFVIKKKCGDTITKM